MVDIPSEEIDKGTFNKRLVKGVIWSSIERFAVQAVQFVISILIARLISPADYGLVAMVSIFMVIAQTFVDSGLSNALIQKKGPTQADFSTALYFNVLMGVVVYTALYLSSGKIALFYSQPQLVDISRWLGLNLIISSLSIVQTTRLTIALDFRGLAKVTVLSVTVSALIGLLLAYYKFGVWSLVAQSLSYSSLNCFLLWLKVKWKPTFVFSWSSFTQLFAFSSRLLLAGVLHNLYGSLYNLIIGRRYNSSELGFFNRASTLAMFPSGNLATTIARAVYPSQCDIQDELPKLQRSFLQNISMQAYIIFPVMVMLAVLSKSLIVVVLTEKWLSAAPILSILSIAYMWYPLMQANYDILNVRGRSDYALKAEILKKLLGIVILILSLPYGLAVICWGLVFYSLVDICVTMYFVEKVVAISGVDEIRAVIPTIAATSLMALAVSCVISLTDNSFYQLLLGVLAGGISYLLLSYLFQIREFSLLRSSLKGIIK